MIIYSSLMFWATCSSAFSYSIFWYCRWN